MKEETKEKLIVVLECLFATIILCIAPFLIKSCSSEQAIKHVSFNNSQLVKRQNDRNGTIDITEYDYADVKTISGSFYDFGDYSLSISQAVIDNNLSLSGSNDVFGYGFNNYFRFSPLLFGKDIVALEYYIEFDDNLTKSYRLCYYYKPIIENDGEANYMRFTPVRRNEFIAMNILPKYDILNISYYVYSNLNTFMDFINNNEFASKLFNIENNYRYSLNYFDNVVNNTLVDFININKDFITPLVSSTSSSSYLDGYNKGYNVGLDDASNNSVFSMLKKGISSLNEFLNIEVLPNVSLWLLMSIPLSISMMVIMFKLLRGD